MAFIGVCRHYVEGRNIRIEIRSAEGRNERLPALVREIVALKPDLIVSANSATTRALKDTTGTIPVVMALPSDPQSLGVIESLARPGGRFTGMSISGRDLFGERIELLKELLPGAGRLLLLWTPLDSGDPAPLPRQSAFDVVQRTAAPAGIEVISRPVRTPEELRSALTTPADGDVDAMLVLRGGVMSISQDVIVAVAAQHRLPTMFTDPSRVAAGGLIGYGTDYAEQSRRVAIYVDRILKGANHADLPVEQPTTFKLIVNLKTARALGLEIPTSILVRADEVIE